MRREITGVVGAALLLVAGAGVPAGAHKDVRISICIPHYKGGPCAKKGEASSYYYGDDVVVKGRARPSHAGRVVIQRRKGGNPWRRVATRALEDRRRYRYVWHTDRDDADQDTPYKFRVRLPDHDTSRVQRVYVLFGE